MDQPLERKEVGDVAVYNQQRQVAPNIRRRVVAKTIVGQGSPEDTALQQGGDVSPGVQRLTAMLKNQPESM